MRHANWAVQPVGPEVIELLRDILTDDADEEMTVSFLFDVCRVAVHAITDRRRERWGYATFGVPHILEAGNPP